jgi:COP9 signalosome complex subunit 3
MKEYTAAMQLLLVVLTCPASCLSAIQADAFKKFALVSLKVNGELSPLPVYSAHIVQRYAKTSSYVSELVEAFKSGDIDAIKQMVEEKATMIEADGNMGLVKQVVASLARHKVTTLTKTYLTLSLTEIAKELGFDGANAVSEVEELLLDMISAGEVKACIDAVTGNVLFEEDNLDAAMGPEMIAKLQERMGHVLELATRIGVFEREIVSSEAYIRKTAGPDGDRPSAAAMSGGFDFMDT